jgi:putative ABC transport system permease protein
MRQLHATEMGFRLDQVLTVRIALPGNRYDGNARRTFFRQLVERVEALPGIQAASVMNCVPLADGCRHTASVQARDGESIDTDTAPILGLTSVSPELFGTLGIPVSRGRTFTDLDREDSQRVVVISEETASRLWPGDEAVGRTLSVRGFEEATVIGVVGEVRHDNLQGSPRPDLYAPALQAPLGEGFLVARISGSASTHIAAIRGVVRDLDSDLPIFDVRMMQDRVADATWRVRFTMLVISLFAAMTFALSAIGIYGAFSHSVEATIHGIGVRMALGATRARVLKGVLRRAVLLALAGIGPGILLALATTRFMEELLFETSPQDPGTFSVISMAFLAMAVSASYIPARKASGVDPAAVLRGE